MPQPSIPLAAETALALLRLLPALGRRADDAARAAASPSATQASQLALLLDGPLRGVELAARLRASRASVTEAVQRLEAAGFVVTEPDPQDRRARRVGITPAGRAALEAFGQATTAAVAAAVQKLPPEQQRAMRDGANALRLLLEPELP